MIEWLGSLLWWLIVIAWSASVVIVVVDRIGEWRYYRDRGQRRPER